MWQHIGEKIHYNGDFAVIKKKYGWLIKKNFNEIGFVKTLQEAKGRVDKMLSIKMYRGNPMLISGYDKRKNPEKHNYRFLSMKEVKAIAENFGRGRFMAIGDDGKVYDIRQNGRPKLWKTRPNDMELPYKFGMYEYGTLVYRDGELVSGPQPVEFDDDNIKGNPDANSEVIRKFVGGSDYANSGSLHIDGLRAKTTVLKTYATPLAIRNMEKNVPVYYVNTSKYSQTSNRHYNILMRELHGEVINLLSEDKLRDIIAKLVSEQYTKSIKGV